MHAEHLNIHIAVLRDQSQEIAFSMETHTFCLLAGFCPPPQQGTYIEMVIIVLETIT